MVIIFPIPSYRPIRFSGLQPSDFRAIPGDTGMLSCREDKYPGRATMKLRLDPAVPVIHKDS